MLPVALLAVALTASPDPVTAGAALEAKDLAHRSLREYDLGQNEEALRDIERAYLLDPLPGLLFNLGQCYRALKHWEKAETAFRNFLRYRPDAPNRATVLELIEEMRMEVETAARARAASLAAHPTPPAPVAPVRQVAPPALTRAPPPAPKLAPSEAAPPPEPPVVWAEDLPPPHRSHALGWSLLGVGAVATVLAIVAAADVASYESSSTTVTTSEATQAGLLTPTFQSLQGQESQAQTWRTVGFVSLGVAIASVPAVIIAW